MFRIKLFIKKFKSEKGVALPTVIMVAAVLIAMLVSILSISEQQFRYSKILLHQDYTYVSGDSAIEKYFGYINEYINDTRDDGTIIDILNDVTYTGDNENYINEIFTKNISKSSKPDIYKVKIGNTESEINYKILNVKPPNADDEIVFEVEVIATSKSTQPGYKIANKQTYAKREFKIKKPSTDKYSPAAVNTIGDLYAKGAMKSNIIGDVKVYGTTPEKPRRMQQEYYGGVYALEKAQMRIEGNAFVRNFIRTGKYMDYVNDADLDLKSDDSTINIIGSAIAQCVQVFGKNDRITVMKDAFTFDDVEMNGENSSIIINGSLFGLSNGKSTTGLGYFHDDSSGLVNSSAIHNINYKESMKSRIVINKAVFLNGSSWLVNEDGTGNYELEAASTAWKRDTSADSTASDDYDKGMATYKTFDKSSNPTTEYQTWVKGIDMEDKRGYGNLIQYFTNHISDELGIQAFVDDLKDDMENGYKKKVGTIPAVIRGFCVNEIAANGSFYKMDAGAGGSGSYKKDNIDKASISDIKDSYINYIDNMNEEKWKEYWTYGLYNGSNGYNILDNSFSYELYCQTVQEALTKIKPILMKPTEGFVVSNYEWAADKISHTLVKAKNNDPMFSYIGGELKKLTNNGISTVIVPDATKAITNTKTGEDEYIINSSSTQLLDSEYYLIYNDDPKLTLVLNNEVNGIIFTHGKVVLEPGAILNGFIIASGRGYTDSATTGYVEDYTAGYVDGYAAQSNDYIPRIKENGSNLLNLDNGVYAGVEFRGDTGEAKINYGDQENAFSQLVEKFTNTSVKSILKSVFK